MLRDMIRDDSGERFRRVIILGACVAGLLLSACAIGLSPLASAARSGRADEVGQWLDSGADPDQRGPGGNTALYHAAQQGHADVVRLLIEAGADVDVDNDFGSTPLHVASRGGHVEVIRALSDAGADLDARNLRGATESELANRSSLETQGLRSSTPLAKAARAGQFEAVRTLIELGAALPARDAAQQASLRGHDEIAAYITRAANERRSQATASAGSSDPFASARTQDLSVGYGRRIAAVIGISQYQKLDDLEGARRDAREMAKLLEALGFDDVFELYDAEATRASILELVGQKLRRITTEKDLVFVFFAGHGATETLPSGERVGYLVPTEGSTVDPYVTGISMETVRDLSNRLAARHVYYAIDACYSGGLVQRGGDRAPAELTRGATEKRAVQVLTAGLEGQQAIEEGGRGLFTTYLLEALRGEANLNGDAYVTASEIGHFVANQVSEVSRGRQTPAYGHLGGTGEITFRLR